MKENRHFARTRRFHLTAMLAMGILACWTPTASAEGKRPNVLLIVADDLSYDSLGFAGGVAPDVTPNIDALRDQSISFERAFANVSVCQPSRQSMMTGLMPHKYGSVGFFPIKKKVDTLPALLSDAGYVTAVIHKATHMLPQEIFKWDFVNETLGFLDGDGYVGRDPQNFVRGMTKVIRTADAKDAPFFFLANSADPHRPFHGGRLPKPGTIFWGDKVVKMKDPSRIYSADEVTVPPELPDLPGIRKDVANYASSVRRLDDTVGACLGVLKQLNKEDSTIVIFLSDNGMPLPFGKFDTYLSSNRTPFLIRLPGRPAVLETNHSHLVSLVDLTPTVLDLVGLPIPEGLDGRSLRPLIKGEKVTQWRDAVVLLRYEDIYFKDGISSILRFDPDGLSKLLRNGWVHRPDHTEEGTYSRKRQQRCYFDGQFAYIYNDWFDPDGLSRGQFGAGVPYGDKSFRSMRKAAQSDKTVAARIKQYLLRSPEELYDWTKDPASRNNLVEHGEYASKLETSRKKMQEWMIRNDDPLIENFKKKIMLPSGR